MNTAVLSVQELFEIASKMKSDGMKYAFIDIELEGGVKQVYFRAVPCKNASQDFDFGCLNAVNGLDG